MGWDKFFKKGWDFTRKIDPLTTRLLEKGSKYASKGVGEIGHGLGWRALEREADKNVENPERGIGRAALATGLVMGGGAALGAFGGGAGTTGAGLGASGAGSSAAGLGGIGEAMAGAEVAGMSGGLGGGLTGAGMEAGITGSSPYAGAVQEAAGMGGGGWMDIAKRFMNQRGGGGQQRGGGSSDIERLLRQMRMAELMRQNAEYSRSYERGEFD